MSKSVKGTKTEQNLLKAFAGESQATNRYLFFAGQAEKDGYREIADFFRQTAEQERVHAKRFFKFLEGGPLEITATYPAGIIGTTEENLAAAQAGELEEATELYPEMARVAREEGFEEIALAWENIVNAEAEHARCYGEFLKRVKAGNFFTSEKPIRWKCRKCGYVYEGVTPPAVCPACLHPQAYYQKLEDAPFGLL